MRPIKVLFIGGSGRSGSTLLDSILGQLEGFVSVGEINEVWRAGFEENRLCGCGERFRSCEFWARSAQIGLGPIGDKDVRRIVELQSRVCRIRRIPWMAWSWLGSSEHKRAVREYGDCHRRLLAGVAEHSGARIVVDSSKSPAHGYTLSNLDSVELHVVQLVRDSRAVAYSWQRTRKVPTADGTDTLMVRMAPWRSAADWNLRHLLLARLGRRGKDSLASYNVVRYEDVVAEPESMLSRIVEPVEPGADVRGLFATPSTVSRRRPTHVIEGNPSKFNRGNLEIRRDDEWSKRMPPFDRALVSLLTAPYLRQFGYL